MVIESDASMLDWGVSLNNTSMGGPWVPQERSHHINYLELLATFLALKTFATNTHNQAILLRLDNVTAMAFLNRMEGTHSDTISSGHLEMTLRKEYIHPCRIPPQEAKCQNRLALATHTGLQ